MTEERRAPVQSDDWFLSRRPPDNPLRLAEEVRLGRELKPDGSIAWSEHVLAHAGYERRFPGQSAERIAERGGFGYGELIEFLGREPTTWRPTSSELDGACITHCCPRCGCKYESCDVEDSVCPVVRGLHPGPDSPYCGEFGKGGRCPLVAGYDDDEGDAPGFDGWAAAREYAATRVVVPKGPGRREVSTMSQADVARRNAIAKWQSVFEWAGFDFEYNDINLSEVGAEAIEAMGRALDLLRLGKQYRRSQEESPLYQRVTAAVAAGEVSWIVDLAQTALTSAQREAHGANQARARLSFAQLREANVTRCEASFHPVEDWSLPDWMTAVTGEVGELAEAHGRPLPRELTEALGRLASVIKNIRRKDTEGASPHAIGPTGPQQMADEAADVAIYLDLLCHRAGIDLGEAVRHKFNEVSDRVGSKVKL